GDGRLTVEALGDHVAGPVGGLEREGQQEQGEPLHRAYSIGKLPARLLQFANRLSLSERNVMKKLVLFAALVLSANLHANENGLPVGHTGSFGEPTCAAAGCHRTEPLNTGNQARVTIDVGPYVPNARQRVIVTVNSSAGN